jgi:hypothetical protein
MKKTLLALAFAAGFLASSAHATIQVDQDYNFTNGPVAGLSAFGPDAPTYSNHQVILGGDDYLQSTTAIAPAGLNAGLEMVLTLPSFSQDRFLGSLGNQGNYSSIQLSISGGTLSARDDNGGGDVLRDLTSFSLVRPGDLVGLAQVWMDNGNGSATTSLYLNGALLGSNTRNNLASESPWNSPQYVTIGSWFGKGTTANGGPGPLSVSEVRTFHFASGQFQTSDLLTVPEPSTYALFGLGAIGILMVMRRKKTA